MRIGSAKAWAKTLGACGAHVQHGFDRLCDWGFRELRKAGSNDVIDTEENPHLARAKRTGKATLRFLGMLGESYFREYENLKKRRSRPQHHP